MKKILSILIMIFILISCIGKSQSDASKENTIKTVKEGDWNIDPKQVNNIDENIKTIFNDASKTLLGVKRELMLYLGNQVLNGVNYAFICRSEITYPSALPYYEIIICNVSDKNEISIVKIDKIIESSQNSAGGISCTSSDEAKINISNSKEANDLIKIFEEAVKDNQDFKYTNQLYVANQVVKGINYYFIAEAVSNNGESSIKLLTINNFIESNELINVKDIL